MPQSQASKQRVEFAEKLLERFYDRHGEGITPKFHIHRVFCINPDCGRELLGEELDGHSDKCRGCKLKEDLERRTKQKKGKKWYNKKKAEPRDCRTCGNTFTPDTGDLRKDASTYYCSDICKQASIKKRSARRRKPASFYESKKRAEFVTGKRLMG